MFLLGLLKYVALGSASTFMMMEIIKPTGIAGHFRILGRIEQWVLFPSTTLGNYYNIIWHNNSLLLWVMEDVSTIPLYTNSLSHGSPTACIVSLVTAPQWSIPSLLRFFEVTVNIAVKWFVVSSNRTYFWENPQFSPALPTKENRSPFDPESHSVAMTSCSEGTWSHSGHNCVGREEGGKAWESFDKELTV